MVREGGSGEGSGGEENLGGVSRKKGLAGRDVGSVDFPEERGGLGEEGGDPDFFRLYRCRRGAGVGGIGLPKLPREPFLPYA